MVVLNQQREGGGDVQNENGARVLVLISHSHQEFSWTGASMEISFLFKSTVVWSPTLRRNLNRVSATTSKWCNSCNRRLYLCNPWHYLLLMLSLCLPPSVPSLLVPFALVYTFGVLILSYSEPRLMISSLPTALMTSSISRLHCSLIPELMYPLCAMILFILASSQSWSTVFFQICSSFDVPHLCSWPESVLQTRNRQSSFLPYVTIHQTDGASSLPIPTSFPSVCIITVSPYAWSQSFLSCFLTSAALPVSASHGWYINYANWEPLSSRNLLYHSSGDQESNQGIVMAMHSLKHPLLGSTCLCSLPALSQGQPFTFGFCCHYHDTYSLLWRDSSQLTKVVLSSLALLPHSLCLGKNH